MQDTLIFKGVEYTPTIKYKILERETQEKDFEIKRLRELVAKYAPQPIEIRTMVNNNNG